MKIIFVQENAFQESLGVSSLVGVLREKGFSADLVLLSHEGDIIDIINKHSPNIIGFSCYTSNYKYYLEIARKIKEQFDIPIIMGGPHPTYYPEVIKEDGIDIICRGEGEYALADLLCALKNGKDYSSINNLWVKKKGKIYSNDFGTLIDNLDLLPLPERKIYYKYSFLKDFPLKRFITGLGCPYNCSFCHEPLYRNYIKGKGRFIRRKSPGRVIAEIEDVRKIARMESIHFSDDIFILDKRWLEEFAMLYKAKVNLRFTANVRFDSLDNNVVTLLKDMGCTGACVGLETGNEYLRNSVLKKDISNLQIIDGAMALRRHNIKMLTYNMTALPGETMDEILETIRLNRRIRPQFVRIYTFQPFSLLELTKYAKANNLLRNIDEKKSDFSMDMQSVNVVTGAENEMRNLCSLFWVLIKFPYSSRILKRILRIKENIFYKIIGYLSLLQEPFFYGVSFWDSWKFFKNIYFVKTGNAHFYWVIPIKNKDK